MDTEPKIKAHKITPFLWFNNNAEEAVNLYTSIFKNSKIITTSRYGEGAPQPKGTLMSVTFELEGLRLIALNGGPQFTFSEAISLFVMCDTQEEIDELWEKLSEGGKKLECGWVKDKFGLAWQIATPLLGKLLEDEDPEKARRVMEAMMTMDKIQIDKLKAAYEGQ